MEPAGLAVGVIGLCGLFNTCLDVVNKYDAWKDFGSESRCLTAQFEAQKLRLQKWGEAVVVEHESVSNKHPKPLDDPRTRSNVQNLLLAIKDICGKEDALSAPISRAQPSSLEGPIQGYPAISKLLVATGADIEAKNNFRRTPLHLASLHGHIEIVILLLERGADVEAKDTDEWTPLINASFEGHAEVVNALLERGADIEAKGTNEYTPLMYASAQGHIEVVRLLLKHGADLMDCDRIGNTSLHLAAYNGQAKVVETLLETSSTHVDALIRLNRTPLFQAATRGHLGVLNILLSHKANANIKDHYCSTPLFTAVRNGHKDVIERLIALAETPIHFLDDLGQTLAWWAARCGDAEIVELILRWAKEHNVEVVESDFQVEGSLLQLGQSSRYCDVCVRYLPANKVYYRCKTCFDFDVC
ncbi:hypothetical protein RU639_010128 [Aspergillus parasiticus]